MRFATVWLVTKYEKTHLLSPVGLEPTTYGLKVRLATSATQANSPENMPSDGKDKGALAKRLTKPALEDHELAAVIAAWPRLPEALKTGIIAMVNSTKKV